MIERITEQAVVTIDGLRNALSVQRLTADVIVLSLSTDEQHCRSRVELGIDAENSIDPMMLASMAVQILRDSFGGTLGALRVDVYRCAPGGCDAVALVATCGDSAGGSAARLQAKEVDRGAA